MSKITKSELLAENEYLKATIDEMVISAQEMRMKLETIQTIVNAPTNTSEELFTLWSCYSFAATQYDKNIFLCHALRKGGAVS